MIKTTSKRFSRLYYRDVFLCGGSDYIIAEPCNLITKIPFRLITIKMLNEY